VIFILVNPGKIRMVRVYSPLPEGRDYLKRSQSRHCAQYEKGRQIAGAPNHRNKPERMSLDKELHIRTRTFSAIVPPRRRGGSTALHLVQRNK
jgi:hypothetical protein